MLNKKNILGLTFTIAIVGLTSEIMSNSTSHSLTLSVFDSLKSIKLGNHLGVYSTNFFNIIFYIIMIASVIIYRGNSSKIHGLGFALTSIFIYNVLSFISLLIYSLFDNINLLEISSILTLLFHAIYGFMSLTIVKFINQNRTLLFVEKVYGDTRKQVAVEASKLERIQNLALDTFLCIFMFSPYLPEYQTGALLKPDGSNFLLVFIIYRLAYYFLSELNFLASPAKYLSGTTIQIEDGGSPQWNHILRRSIFRLIPFNALSFIGHSNWHDSWSKTEVVKLQIKEN